MVFQGGSPPDLWFFLHLHLQVAGEDPETPKGSITHVWRPFCPLIEDGSSALLHHASISVAQSDEWGDKVPKIIERLINKWEGVKGDRGGEIFKRQQLHDKFLD